MVRAGATECDWVRSQRARWSATMKAIAEMAVPEMAVPGCLVPALADTMVAPAAQPTVRIG
jgi:hypothetical protein